MNKERVRELRRQRNQRDKRANLEARFLRQRTVFLQNLKTRALSAAETETIAANTRTMWCELCGEVIDDGDIIAREFYGIKSPNFERFAHRRHFHDADDGAQLGEFAELIERLKMVVINLELQKAGFAVKEEI